MVGTTLEVTPRVTHDNVIIADVAAKESFVNGEFNGVPIEDKRELTSTARLQSGQTIFMGGLRKRSDGTQITKVPVLGDVPVLNFLFRRNLQTEETNELLIFMTCEVLEPSAMLKPHQQMVYENSKNQDMEVQTEHDVVYNTVHPDAMREPIWKWRRSE
jgi:type II secretory pathway component GspD/PulD (secretin)